MSDPIHEQVERLAWPHDASCGTVVGRSRCSCSRPERVAAIEDAIREAEERGRRARFEELYPGLNTGCWLWTGRLNWHGYGTMWFDGKVQLAHRVYYGLVRGEIPPGKQIDHLCRVRCCVNPSHMEPVTGAENTRRGLTARQNGCCRNGHEIAKYGLTRKRKDGYDQCQECVRLRVYAPRRSAPEGAR